MRRPVDNKNPVMVASLGFRVQFPVSAKSVVSGAHYMFTHKSLQVPSAGLQHARPHIARRSLESEQNLWTIRFRDLGLHKV